MFVAQDPSHRSGKLRDAVIGHDVPPPSHLGVGPHQYAAALGHLPQKHPVVVEVEHLAASPDHKAGDLHTRAREDFCPGFWPALPSNPTHQCEPPLPPTAHPPATPPHSHP